MKRYNILRLAVMAMLIAIGVVISPILRIEGMCPMAHLINNPHVRNGHPAARIDWRSLRSPAFRHPLQGFQGKDLGSCLRRDHRNRHHRRDRFLPRNGIHLRQRRPWLVFLRSLIYLRNAYRRHGRRYCPLQAPAYGRFAEDAAQNS